MNLCSDLKEPPSEPRSSAASCHQLASASFAEFSARFLDSSSDLGPRERLPLGSDGVHSGSRCNFPPLPPPDSPDWSTCERS